jgi:hypothetical protein
MVLHLHNLGHYDLLFFVRQIWPFVEPYLSPAAFQAATPEMMANSLVEVLAPLVSPSILYILIKAFTDSRFYLACSCYDGGRPHHPFH